MSAHVLGTILDTGTKFWSSADMGKPFDFSVGRGQLIKGFDKGVAGMKNGSKRILYIPPEEGYGSGGMPQAGITGTDTLVFEIDVVSVQ